MSDVFYIEEFDSDGRLIGLSYDIDADRLEVGDVFPSHDDLVHTVDNIIYDGEDDVMIVRVRRNDDTFYTSYHRTDERVRVMT